MVDGEVQWGGWWILLVVFATVAQTARNAAQRSLTADLGTWPATLVRFLYGLPLAALALVLLYTVPQTPPQITHWSWAYFGWIALAAQTGADALIVSNHGGRQLDGAPATIDALPSIAQAAGKDIEVWMDSGIRSGQDVLKARALGAQGTLIGRSFLYGLGAFGQEGVAKALQIIQKELDVSMAFCGHTHINQVDSKILVPGTYPRPY